MCSCHYPLIIYQRCTTITGRESFVFHDESCKWPLMEFYRTSIYHPPVSFMCLWNSKEIVMWTEILVYCKFQRRLILKKIFTRAPDIYSNESSNTEGDRGVWGHFGIWSWDERFNLRGVNAFYSINIYRMVEKIWQQMTKNEKLWFFGILRIWEQYKML